MRTAITIICAWCKCYLGSVEGGEGVSHGICASCLAKQDAEIEAMRGQQ